MDADNAVAEATAAPRQNRLIAPPDSYVAFFRTKYRLLMAYAMHVGADRHEADEVANQTLAQMLPNWETITEPLAWARRAVINNLIKMRAAEHRRLLRQSKYLAATFERPTDGHPADWDPASSLHELLAILTPPQRTVVEHLLDGRSQKEIALLLGCSYEAIRRTLSDVRQRLAPMRRTRASRNLTRSATDSSDAARKEDQ